LNQAAVDGLTTASTPTFAGLVTTGTITSQSWVHFYGQIHHRSNLAVLNKAGTDWVIWATENHAGAETVMSLSAISGIALIDGGTVGQAAGPLLTFDDTNNYLEITGCNVGINDTAPAEALDVTGNINVTGVYKVDDVQVVQNRQAAIAEPAETTAANTSAIKYMLDTLAAHGLVTAQEKVSNGGFDSTTTGWMAWDGIYECTIASVAGGQSGNCLEITRVAGDAQTCSQTVSGLVIGVNYTISAYVKSGTSGNGGYQIWTGSGGSVEGTSSNSWVFNSDSFVATGTTEEIRVWKNNADAGTMLFDTVSLKVTQ
jgi:hypothetical protein